MTDVSTLYKFMILFMLSKVEFPLTTAQISDFFLSHGYTSYFTLQTTLAQMLEADLLSIERTHNRTLYSLTPAGMKALELFPHQLSREIEEDILHFLQEKESSFRLESSITANYYFNEHHEYEVHCKIMEGKSTLLDLRFTVPTETEAKAIVSHWSERYEKLYPALLFELL